MDVRLSKIRNNLGRPYFETENFLLYNRDCLSSMVSIPSGMMDLTVTSPPYNIGKEYETIMDTTQYIEWTFKWIKEIYRITSNKGAFLLNLGYISLPGKAKAIPLPYLIWQKIDFYLMQEIVWNYGAGVAGKRFLSPRNEKFLWYTKDHNDYTFNLDEIRDPDVKYPKQKKNGKLRCNTIGKNPSDVWQIAKVTSGANRSSQERAPHPAQFPRDLIDRIVKGFSNVNDLIMDPFMGSGTTAESAILNNRVALGFEIRQDYCDYIIHRITQNIEIYSKEVKITSSPQITKDLPLFLDN